VSGGRLLILGAAFFCAAFVSFWTAATASAQDAPAGCEPALVAVNDHSLERITVTSPCRRNEKVIATYGVLRQERVFSAEGVAHFAIALTKDPSPVIIHYKDGNSSSMAIDTSNLPSVFRITLQWDAPVDLNLHVIEPGGKLGAHGDAASGHAPEIFGLKGRIDLEDDGSGLSPFQESYVFPNALQRPAGEFTIHVENVTLGRSPSGPYCGTGEYAQIEFSLLIADRGEVKKRNYKQTFPCGPSPYVKPHF
jgi:hypothetical protein